MVSAAATCLSACRAICIRSLSTGRDGKAVRRQRLLFAGRFLDKTSPFLTAVPLDDYLGSVGCARDVAEGYDITHLAAGRDFALVAYRTRSRDAPRERVFAVGNNTVGQLGLGYNSHEMTRGMVDLSEHSEAMILDASQLATEGKQAGKLPSNRSGQILQIAAGRESSFLLLSRPDGQRELLAWGGSSFGSSGLGHSTNTLNNFLSTEMTVGATVGRQIALTTKPKRVALQSDPISVHCGLDHTVVRTASGLYSTGWNADGQLGRQTDAPHESTHFEAVTCPFEPSEIKTISTVADHTVVLLQNGEIFSWGNSEYGQCMTGVCEHRQVTPAKMSLSLPEGRHVIDVAAGGSFSLVLDNAGTVYACGRGALGLGPKPEDLESLHLRPLPCHGITRLVSQVHYAVLINDTAQKAYTVGINTAQGILGIGAVPAKEFPSSAFLPVPLSISHAEGNLRFGGDSVFATGGDTLLALTGL